MSESGDMRVTLRDVYEAVKKLDEGMNDLRSDVRLSTAQNTEIRERQDDHESRLRQLERRIWAMPSTALIISVISVSLAVIQWVTK